MLDYCTPNTLHFTDSVAYVTHTMPAPQNPLSPRTQLPLSVISNNRLLRDGLLQLLQTHLDFQLVGSYTATEKLASTWWFLPNHIVLLDTTIGYEESMVWMHRWQTYRSPAAVIALALTNDPAEAMTYIKMGVRGYVMQGASAVDVAEAIHVVCCGQAFCPPEVTAYLFRWVAERPIESQNMSTLDIALTQRELEVLHLLGASYSNKAIAATLVIEERTVKHHVRNILRKFQVRHRWDAVRVALAQRLIRRSVV